ncbi:MAG: tRNA (N6-threonylcarbamoyladenosine(37)-N6)-methyltransferase TrmO [Deltaproteobacteria bacterium]|nr:MAG: tRNA (N6-threonylcarbamoyladenosine(37)-N6)-methyltransferase TrmO [Deltaproteobacteria bacterium]
MSSTSFPLLPIGWVRSPFLHRADCPKQAGKDDPVSHIDIAEHYLPALHGLEKGQEVIVLTWLDRGDRTVLQCHPRGNPQRAVRGVFATRSPDRPNPIGHHQVTILDINGTTLTVHPMEAMHETPVLDIKSVQRPAFGASLLTDDPQQSIIRTGRDGWQRGLFNGMNGNISLKMGDQMLITGTGSAKGHLTPQDLTRMDRAAQEVMSGPPPSSETPVHLSIYARQPKAEAILHTHPPYLLALSLAPHLKGLQELPLFEGRVFAEKMTQIPAFPPGTNALAQAAGEASLSHSCILMDNHGLVVWATDLVEALALTEEIESLARICLLQGAVALY